MGERAGRRVGATPDQGDERRLGDLCANTADARRRLAAAPPHGPVDLRSRLAAILAGLADARVDARDRGSLMVLLDEIGGLVGQLEIEREAARARIAALDRHRQAQRSYAAGRGPQ